MQEKYLEKLLEPPQNLLLVKVIFDSNKHTGHAHGHEEFDKSNRQVLSRSFYDSEFPHDPSIHHEVSPHIRDTRDRSHLYNDYYDANPNERLSMQKISSYGASDSTPKGILYLLIQFRGEM